MNNFGPDINWGIAIPAIVIYLGLTVGALWLVYFLLTLPMRRNERARLFLDILELGIAQGDTPEDAIVKAASSRDSSLGVRFHLLAAYLQEGQNLPAALDSVPRLLPPEAAAMLRAGHRMGNLALVLPASRQIMRDAVGHVNGALNYLLLLAFLVSPVMILVPIMLRIKVIPAFNQIFEGMTESPIPAFSRLVFDTLGTSTLLIALLTSLLWMLTLAYIGGPRLRALTRRIAPMVVDRLLYALPWRRKRMQRDFTHILSLLLDSGVPEAEAVRLAASAVDNLILRRHAENVADALAKGIPLPDAIHWLDNSGEVRWRLKNALASGRAFTRALTGWLYSLDARAEQQEQAAAQVVTTGVVLLNGLFVGMVVTSVFLMLVQLIQEATLW